MEQLAEQILLSNKINWIPLRYIYNVRMVAKSMYELSFISGGSLTLKM